MPSRNYAMDGRATREYYEEALATFMELAWFLLGALPPSDSGSEASDDKDRHLVGILFDAIVTWATDAADPRLSRHRATPGTGPILRPTPFAALVAEFLQRKHEKIRRGSADPRAVATVAMIVARDLDRSYVEACSDLADAEAVKIVADRVAIFASHTDPARFRAHLAQARLAARISVLRAAIRRIGAAREATRIGLGVGEQVVVSATKASTLPRGALAYRVAAYPPGSAPSGTPVVASSPPHHRDSGVSAVVASRVVSAEDEIVVPASRGVGAMTRLTLQAARNPERCHRSALNAGFGI